MTIQNVKSISAILVTLSLTCTVCDATPIPAAGTSALTDPSKASAVWSQEMDVSRSVANWQLNALERQEDKTKSMEFTLKEGSEKARLQVYRREISKAETLDSQVKKWSKEFAQYGFEILAAKQIHSLQYDSYTFDLYHRDKQIQARQVLIPNQQSLAIVTCMDDKTSFARTFGDCQEFVRNLKIKKTDP